MRVIHIIPAAFDYFDDIKQAAFRLIDSSPAEGVEAEALTLQYGTVTKQEEGETTETAPSFKFVGLSSLEKGIVSLDYFDVVHIHCPFFGAARKIIAWKIAHPGHPLVATFYHPFQSTDFFSLIIQAYAAYYTPRVLRLADVVASPDMMKLRGHFGKRFSEEIPLVEVDGSPFFEGIDLTAASGDARRGTGEFVAAKYALVYSRVCSSLKGGQT